MCALTPSGVTGHFISTFIVVIIRDIVGVTGPNLAWLLAAYGVAGLASMAVLARPGDRHPRAAIGGCLGGLALVFAVLATLGYAGGASAGNLLAGIVAVIAWGATAAAMPPMLQSAAMRHSPDDPRQRIRPVRGGLPGGHHGRFLLGGLLFGLPARRSC